MTTHRMTRFPKPLITALPVWAISPSGRADTGRPGSGQRLAPPANGPTVTAPDLSPVQNAPFGAPRQTGPIIMRRDNADRINP